MVGCVGRFVPRKGHARVIEAAAALRARGYDLEVLVVGTGRLEGRLRILAERRKLPITFCVDVPWNLVPDLYRRMDVFCLPVRSRWLGLEEEGLGIVFLEAAASGLPVVAGASGGAPETVLPGVTGFVTHHREDLLEALELLVTHPERAGEMGARGRELMAREFSWEAVTERFRAGVEAAIAARRE